jgi:hypothetical protein
VLVAAEAERTDGFAQFTPRGPMPNGWIYRGKLVRLRPYDGRSVAQEVW